MLVKKGKGGSVSVRYTRTHTNHTPGLGELKHVPLPQSVKKEVREKYGQNVKLDCILDGMKHIVLYKLKILHIHYQQVYEEAYQTVVREMIFL